MAIRTLWLSRHCYAFPPRLVAFYHDGDCVVSWQSVFGIHLISTFFGVLIFLIVQERKKNGQISWTRVFSCRSMLQWPGLIGPDWCNLRCCFFLYLWDHASNSFGDISRIGMTVLRRRFGVDARKILRFFLKMKEKSKRDIFIKICEVRTLTLDIAEISSQIWRC